MLTDTISCYEERGYALERLFLYLGLTIASFGLAYLHDGYFGQVALKIGFVLIVIDMLSLMYYYGILYAPRRLMVLRRIAVMLTDIGFVTYCVGVAGYYGYFLVGAYFVILVRMMLDYGALFGVLALMLVLVGLAVVWYFFPYWHTQETRLLLIAVSAFWILVGLMRMTVKSHGEHHRYAEAFEGDQDQAASKETEGISVGLPQQALYAEMVSSLTRGGRPFCVFMIECTRLDSVIRRYGKEVGRETLMETVERIKKHLKHGDTLIRMDGSKLAIVSTRDPIFVEKFAARLVRYVTGRHRAIGILVPIEIRIGISCFPMDTPDESQLALCADTALFAAKEDESRYYYFYHELSAEQKEAYMQR